MRKSVIRVGDRVKIINPEIFVRCGYNLSLDNGYEFVNGIIPEISNFLYSIELDPTEFGNLEKELAFLYIKNLNFGGANRIIHTKTDPLLENRVGRVRDKKVVRTGIRTGGACYEEGEEPNYLSDLKSHVILDISTDYSNFWIEQKNVQKIVDISVESV